MDHLRQCKLAASSDLASIRSPLCRRPPSVLLTNRSERHALVQREAGADRSAGPGSGTATGDEGNAVADSGECALAKT